MQQRLDDPRRAPFQRAADAGAACRPMRPQNARPNHAARAERELRPRADGAAHARRRRRLHAEGRHRGGARVHRLDDRAVRGRAAASASSRACTTRARRSCSATRSRRAAASTTANRCSTSWRRIPSTAHFIAHEARAAGSSATSRRRRSSIAPPRRFRETDGDLREVMRTILTSPEFFAPDAYRAKVKTPFEFVVSAPSRATGADVVNDAAAGPRGAAARHAALQCQPPTGYNDTADAWVNTGALSAG